MTRFLATTALATLIAGAASAQDMIGASDVSISGNDVMIGSVTASQDGYLVLHAMKDGKVVAPASIGHTAIKAGDNMKVIVTSDEVLTEGTGFAAMLHVESNGNDTYDFAEGMTDVDTPVMADGAAVVQTFNTTAAMMDGTMDSTMDSTTDGTMDSTTDGTMMPMIDAADVSIDGATATFANVVAETDGYLVIHTILDGAPIVPASIGHAPVMAGDNADLAVTIAYDFVAGETYFAMLHEETNGNDTYDFGEGMTDVDTPVMSGGKVVGEVFGQ